MIAPEVADTACALAEALIGGTITRPDSFDDWRQQARWSALLRCEHAASVL
jgi:glycine oxidase